MGGWFSAYARAVQRFTFGGLGWGRQSGRIIGELGILTATR